MANTKPIIKRITPIDIHNTNNTYSMSYSGGVAQIYTVVYDANTLEIVADQTYTTLSPSDIPIPVSNKMENGKRYAIEAIVYDKNGDRSTVSDKVFFWALTTPLFYFDGIYPEVSKRINAASYNAKVVYLQDENEPLTSFVFYWYDDGKVLLDSTEASYAVDDISHIYRGMESDRFYYIRCVGATKNGITIDTGYIQLYVEYNKSNPFSQIIAFVKNEQKECNGKSYSDGVVTYATNIIDVQANRDDYTYDEDGFINLTNDVLEYDEIYKDMTAPQFEIDGDFTFAIKFRGGYGKIFEFRDKNGKVGQVNVIKNGFYTIYELVIEEALSDYRLYTYKCEISNYTVVTLVIRRKNISSDPVSPSYLYSIDAFYGEED